MPWHGDQLRGLTDLTEWRGNPLNIAAGQALTHSGRQDQARTTRNSVLFRVMHIETPRFFLRDFSEADRQPFIDYQMEPRYRHLYDLSDADPASANALFDLFGEWQRQNPRQNYQVGIFDRMDSRLGGCAGLRQSGQPERTAVLGLELSPDNWGRYGMAIDCSGALLACGFSTLNLGTIIGATASGNNRVEALALWFGAAIVDRRDGPLWMKTRGWHEVEWALSRAAWELSPGRRRLLRRT
jgi:ribosomal-protein-alanine N-acetyltransferase